MALSRAVGAPPIALPLDAGDGTTTQLIEVVLLLLVVATVLAVAARRFAIPYPVVLVVGGLALGFVPGLPTIELEPDVVFILFLPPILFAAGYFTSFRALRLKAAPIALLAVGLVLFTTVVVAVVAYALVPSLGWPAAFALGAIVAPPDAVAATTIFQRLGVPRRIIVVLEGESLLNDATALVAYRLAVGVAMGRVAFSVVDAGTSFVVAAAGGVAVGLLVGIAVAWLVARIDDEVFSVIVTFLAPVFAYVPADQIGLSGVLATVVAGIWVGLHAPKALSSRVRVSGFASWQILLFLVNGAVFILIGLTLPGALARLGDRPPGELLVLAVAVSIAAIAARIVWVPTIYLPYAFRRRRADPGSPVIPLPESRHLAIIAWAGMRGVVSLAAALALPLDFPERDLIIFLTFAVILATLVGQGLTLPILIDRLNIDDGAGATGQEEAFARYVTSDAATARLDDLAAEWPGHLELIDNLRAQYGHRARHAEIRQGPAESDEEEQELIEHRQIRMGVLMAEREALLNLRDRGAISDDIFRKVERDLDLEEIRMEA
ncbi:MAG TPA: Na+/H+ antiporter [Candidatus Limnocylindrales bacterium]|nr:Na+/H+ antiporter [Candidatus Limnocylindrales bacterium]